ncbi:MAG: hypothetical protein CVU63_03570 [Deltaproteobacteria bacterium HGW-Deltaproteobacteria-20]|nr:MAG: hypothetical protein CVU63_03570 [Deltaproteobacteria bacterium HGW-Deltaproteobacteria-20]
MTDTTDVAADARSKTAICLTGGGVTGGLYQLGALSALETVVEFPPFDITVGTSSGASVAAAIAGGLPVARLYRALLDPADNYFPLERSHVLSLDVGEWRRTIESGMSAIRHGLATLIARSPAPMPADLWEQLDRLFDALPAGLLSLDRYEHFLADFFLRRRVPNSFRSLQRQLLITATDLDGGDIVLFGGPDHDHVPVSLACAASMALPLFFSPVRIGERYYVDGSVAPTTEIDIAVAQGAKLILVLNPNVPIRVSALPDGVPTGHGIRSSLRDKGLMWVYNQAMRTAIHARLAEAAARVNAQGSAHVLLLEPEPDVAVRFVNNAASPQARREIMHASHRASRARFRAWASENADVLASHGWRFRADNEPEKDDSPQAQP